ncbi:MAG TPA: TIGR03619 family F420-dependent LLM class oxidoreductase [Aestuariivirgaceae bacterium]|nr:TIGR03619 family F420-dependent LLM class oxidoreductase [Aestuariivirgaceae bacterium]
MTLNVGILAMMRGAMASRDGTLAIAREAERLGFSHIGINDHVVVPRDISSKYPYSDHGQWAGKAFGECMELLTTMAFIAGATETIRILSSVMILPYRPPVLTAKMIATADVLSGGRMIVGCGVGWMLEEFEALSAPAFKDRGAASDEFLAAFNELWTAEEPSMRGNFVHFSGIAFEPKPLQRSRPPIWIGGESRIALKRTVQFGDGWYPASNNPQRRLDTPGRLRTDIEILHRLCEEMKREPATVDVGLAILWPVSWVAEAGTDGSRKMLTGSSDQLASDLDALERAGVRNLSLLFQTATVNETIDRMQRFSQEVLVHRKPAKA